MKIRVTANENGVIINSQLNKKDIEELNYRLSCQVLTYYFIANDNSINGDTMVI